MLERVNDIIPEVDGIGLPEVKRRKMTSPGKTGSKKNRQKCKKNKKFRAKNLKTTCKSARCKNPSGQHPYLRKKYLQKDTTVQSQASS